MHYHDDMTGFLSELKGGGSATAPSAAPAHPSAAPLLAAPAPLLAAPAPAVSSGPSSSHRLSRSALTGLPIPAFSAALSSSAGPAGPVFRTFSGLRSGPADASIGSLNTTIALHQPPSLSADPPLHPAAPPRAPTSPIPHLNHSVFPQTSSYHHLAPSSSFSHLNASPASLPRQALNYSPTPPHHPPHRLPTPQPPSVHQRPPSTHPQPPPPASAPASSTPAPTATAIAPPVSAPAPPPARQPPDSYPPHSASAAPSQYHHHHSYPAATVAAPTPIKLEQHPPHQLHQHHPSHIHHQQQHHQPSHHPAAPQPVSAAASAVTALPLSNSDAGSQQPDARRQPSTSRTPSKRPRNSSDRPAHLEPTTPRSAPADAPTSAPATATATAQYWAHQAATKGRSPRRPAEGLSAPAEEQSRPERKREREKRRRETMNTRFGELAACLVISAGGKSDKESILAEAVDHVKKQASIIADLEKQNRDLMIEAKSLREEKIELRQDKNYIRKECDRYKMELEALRAENKSWKRFKPDNGLEDDDQLPISTARVKNERVNGIKAEVKA